MVISSLDEGTEAQPVAWLKSHAGKNSRARPWSLEGPKASVLSSTATVSTRDMPFISRASGSHREAGGSGGGGCGVWGWLVPQRLLGSALLGFSLGIAPKGSDIPGRQEELQNSDHIFKHMLPYLQTQSPFSSPFLLSSVNRVYSPAFLPNTETSIYLLTFYYLCRLHPKAQLKIWAPSDHPCY